MRPIAATAVLLLTLGGLEGCGPAKHPTAPVSGKVTFKGKPLNRGRVVFIQEAGPWGYGDIGANGSYEFDAPVGSCSVAISCREDPPELPPEKVTPGVYLNLKRFIPEHYEDPMLSGLKFTVQPDTNNMADWKLK